jgi:hypothetical protein
LSGEGGFPRSAIGITEHDVDRAATSANDEVRKAIAIDVPAPSTAKPTELFGLVEESRTATDGIRSIADRQSGRPDGKG